MVNKKHDKPSMEGLIDRHELGQTKKCVIKTISEINAKSAMTTFMKRNKSN